MSRGGKKREKEGVGMMWKKHPRVWHKEGV
jgi:hypothetical protein